MTKCICDVHYLERKTHLLCVHLFFDTSLHDKGKNMQSYSKVRSRLAQMVAIATTQSASSITIAAVLHPSIHSVIHRVCTSQHLPPSNGLTASSQTLQSDERQTEAPRVTHGRSKVRTEAKNQKHCGSNQAYTILTS